ncbi:MULTISPECIES: CPBP family intramembrane glutamic endopeptidase [Actinoplanes]|uniref:CAAX protease n=2 Tax=Actinoplanes TaxID=1865 RepID=A0A0X3UPH3_9ACTN|nr:MULTISPECIES: CPBP family intramembrane glutamic endopeptidase [Actinoplanes]KUL34491.1 CAAX protease [Actinoplanes awajinensis subsp. mycoplanecinus]GIE66464.1 CAAX amino protease [Actinoplanes palleronii]
MVAVTLERQQSTRSAYTAEIIIVLLLSLGQSAIFSVVSLTAKLTDGQPLASHTATLNAPLSARPYLDLTYQLLNIFFDLVPVALAWYLLRRDDIRPGRDLGIDFRRPAHDAGWGAALAAGIGIPGLLLVYAAIQLGASAQIVPSALQPYWWAVPVLILSAVQNAVLEEVLVIGYLMTRLRQLELSVPRIIICSAVLRGSYHLYQGFGGFVGNVVMGVVFALFYLRTKRVMPLIVAHSLLDITAFVGYELLPDSWLDWLKYHP